MFMARSIRTTVSVPEELYSALEKAQTRSLAELRTKRSDGDVKRALAALSAALGRPLRETKLMPLIIDAVRARATVGEISAELAKTWGYYRPPA